MKNSVFELKGKTAIVTGGGIGIGAAIAVEFARAGADVAIASRDPEHLEKVSGEIKRLGRKTFSMAVDVRQPDQVNNLVKRAVDELGRIDILVNNAGASFRCPAENISPNGWNAVVSINLNGTFLCAQAAAKVMMKQKKGKIINLSSIASILGDPLMSHYGAAKAGINNLTKSLAVEWAPYNINVNAIAPGPIETEGMKDTFKISENKKGGPTEITALKRWGRPEEIAYAAIFLASEASDYITGFTLIVDGGATLRQIYPF